MPSATKENKLIVFLSHASEDKPLVLRLCKRLRKDGFDPWLDVERLKPGQNWKLEIEKAMNHSHAVLLCFSQKSLLKVGYIQQEYKKALDLQNYRPPGTIYVIPVRMDTACDYPEFFIDLQCVDYPQDYKNLASTLQEQAKEVLPRVPPKPRASKRLGMPATLPSVMPVSVEGAGEVVDRIFNRADLDRLVQKSFKNVEERQEILAEAFPAGAAKLSTQEFTEEFIQNNEISRLLNEIKKRNLVEYRKFLVAQTLYAVGLSPKKIPVVTLNTKLVEKELLKLQKTAISQQKPSYGDNLEFEDRIDLLEDIHDNSEFSHIVLHGPSGVGKTYFLNHFPNYVKDRFKEDTRCVLIDLDPCEPSDILDRAIHQLGEEESHKSNYLELATIIKKLFYEDPTINRFYFLFDNADKNQPAIDYLFGPDNIIDHPTLKRILKDWGLLEKIQLKIVMAARHPVTPSKIHPAFSKVQQQKMVPLRKSSVQHMLEKLMKERQIPVHLNLVKELTAEVYYLTGGHPKCAKQMLVALAERGCVKQTEEEWEELYREYVIPTIHTEMLQSFDAEFLSIIWNLSIFRRFDQSLLWGLLDWGVLPVLSGDTSLQALDLGARLVKINLFDTESKTSTISTNYVMRHALSLNMQLDSLDRYKCLHAIALEIYLERFLGSEPTAEKQIERLAANLLELIYHWTKLLEVEVWKKGSQLKSKPICARLQDAFESYLLMVQSMVQIENHPAFYQSLKKRWEDDEELQESIRRITPQDDCPQELFKILKSRNENLQDQVQ